MKTIIIQIGNSDNKLTQKEWSEFCNETHELIESKTNIHFSGFSNSNSEYQNACWVCECYEYGELKEKLRLIRIRYNQDSTAFTVGETFFL